MLIPAVLTAVLAAPQDPPSRTDLEAATRVAGLEFTEAELEMMLRDARENVRSYAAIRARDLANAVPPAFTFVPLGPDRGDDASGANSDPVLPEVERPDDLESLAYADLATLASLIKHRKVTSRELTDMYLARLRRLDQTLLCVVTFLEDRARARADELDALLDSGTWLGPLHGIPYGAKDLLSTKGAPTTWGAKPYQDQVIDADAAVIERLDAAGAVLCAKLTLGALAMGDVWFGGKTRNPWNPRQGSSGSSAGSASATAAGGLPFAIGSETLGSIVSPSTRCGCSSLRPTFGVVDTRGALALSWTMDKLGPMGRSAQDVRLVFDALRPVVGGQPLRRRFDDVKRMRIGYDAQAFERSPEDRVVLDELRAMGFEPRPVKLPDYPLRAMLVILHCEAAAAFDELTRSDRDDELVEQGPRAWPNSFRVARLIPAVEYIQAQRLRTLLMRDTEEALARVDAFVHPSFSLALTLTNLTGHPTFVAPFRPRKSGAPRSISFTGKLYGDLDLLALVEAWQATTPYEDSHPPEPK